MGKLCLVPIIVILNSYMSLAGPMTLPEARKVYREETECLKRVRESDNFFFRSEYVPLWKEARICETEDSYAVHVPVKTPYHYYAVMKRQFPRRNQPVSSIEFYLAECHHEVVVKRDKASGETTTFNRFVLSAGDVDMGTFPNDGSVDGLASLEMFAEMDGRVTYMKPYSSDWDGAKFETGNDRGRHYRMVAEVQDRIRDLIRSRDVLETGVVLDLQRCPECGGLFYHLGSNGYCFHCGGELDGDMRVYPEYYYQMGIPYPSAASHADSLRAALNELDDMVLHNSGGSGHSGSWGIHIAGWDGQEVVMQLATDAELDSLARHGSTPVQRIVGYEGLLRRNSPLCFGTLLSCLHDDEEFESHFVDLEDYQNVADYMVFLSFCDGQRIPFDERQMQVLADILSTGRYPHINPRRLPPD